MQSLRGMADFWRQMPKMVYRHVTVVDMKLGSERKSVSTYRKSGVTSLALTLRAQWVMLCTMGCQAIVRGTGMREACLRRCWI